MVNGELSNKQKEKAASIKSQLNKNQKSIFENLVQAKANPNAAASADQTGKLIDFSSSPASYTGVWPSQAVSLDVTERLVILIIPAKANHHKAVVLST